MRRNDNLLEKLFKGCNLRIPPLSLLLFLILTACTTTFQNRTPLRTSPSIAHQKSIATVSFLKGNLFVKGAMRSGAVKEGAKLYQGDRLKTLSNTRVKLVFVDNTTVILGDNTEFLLESFEYDRKNSERRVNFNHLKGVFKLATGKLKRKKSTNRFTVRTVHAVVGVKGTEFWGGTLREGRYDLALLAGTAIEVSNASGAVLIEQVGYGITLTDPDTIPKTSIQWPASKVQRALATVAF